MSLKIFIAALVTVALSACQGMVPQGAGPGLSPVGMSPSAADKKADTADAAPGDVPADVSSDFVSKDVPPASPNGISASEKLPEFAAADAKAQPGGVSALPADVGGGEGSKTPFDFTLSGTADPVCTEPAPQKNMGWLAGMAPIKYHVTGTVGAALLDGTVVPLNGCGQVALRYQEGTGASARCEDVRVSDDCQFNLYVSLRHADQAKAYLYTHYLNPGLPIPPDYNPCGDMDNLSAPSKNEVTFAPVPRDPLPVCQPLQIDGIFQKSPSFLEH